VNVLCRYAAGGLGGNMQRLVCYAQMATATGRKFVLVPQYTVGRGLYTVECS
jgi:hypothetical protein